VRCDFVEDPKVCAESKADAQRETHQEPDDMFCERMEEYIMSHNAFRATTRASEVTCRLEWIIAAERNRPATNFVIGSNRKASLLTLSMPS
jgi:hypothetical protein